MIAENKTATEESYTGYVPFMVEMLRELPKSEAEKINELFVKNNLIIHIFMVISLLVVIVSLFVFSSSIISSAIVLIVFFLLQLSMYKILYVLTALAIKYKEQSLVILSTYTELETICDDSTVGLRIKCGDKYMLLSGKWVTEEHEVITGRGSASSI